MHDDFKKLLRLLKSNPHLMYRKNLFMKEKLYKKEQHKLYIHYLQYTQVILLEKQNNSSTIAYLLI